MSLPKATAAAGSAPASGMRHPVSDATPTPPRAGAFTEPLIRAESVTRAYRRSGGFFGRGTPVLALRGVDIELRRGEAVGVVGESGCGKSTLGRVLLHLHPPSSGRVLFEGQDIAGLRADALRTLRRRMQIVFQDPYLSLDPRRAVGRQIADGMQIHGMHAGAALRERVEALLRQVGLDPDHGSRLPHEFSGGQRQRIAIARALATEPEFIVADEPVSALDVSIQAQVINLFADLKTQLGLALLFISHDLHVVRHLCDRVVVMYLGRVVEEGPAAELFHAPAHPYTRALLGATPSLRQHANTAAPLAGEVPSIASPPSGCGFRTRCTHAQPACASIQPDLTPLATAPARRVACIRADSLS